jgi:acyl-coenzyme A thioesterase PaaI-like protein
MPVITDLAQGPRGAIRAEAHAHCVVCGPSNERGLRLEFSANADDSVRADFDCDPAFEAYASILHGGVVASPLDGAMTNCLFAHRHSGVTAGFTMRFRRPVRTGSTVTVRAWIERCYPPLHVFEAEVVQDGGIKATARGKFIDRAHASEP